ncbi:MAG: hypothetical protein ACFCVG_18250 [Kineosporiaceae bacterium]
MTRLVLDAGALVAYERRDRTVAARLEVARRHGLRLRTTAVVLAQVWRDDPRQALLAQLLKAVEVVAVDEELGRRTGGLLARSGTADPVAATVVLVAEPGDSILTSDPRDIRHLVDTTRTNVRVVAC